MFGGGTATSKDFAGARASWTVGQAYRSCGRSDDFRRATEFQQKLRVELEASWEECGLDSLSSIAFARRLSDTFDLSFDATTFFDFSSPALLAQSVWDSLTLHPGRDGWGTLVKCTYLVMRRVKDAGGVRDVLCVFHVLDANMDVLTDDLLLADLSLVKSYMPRSDRKLTCPIIGIHANDDVLVPSSRTVAAWSAYTTRAFSMHQIDGTHFFFFRPPASFVVLLQSCLDAYDCATWPGAGAYELQTFWWGTLDLHAYPFGVSPKGYIIYTDGHVFVHLCDPLVDSAKPLAAAHSHAFYHGTYDVENGAVFHNIEMSNNPNDHADVLGRYFHWQEEGRKLTLSTQPDSMRAAGGTLIWQRLPDCGGNHQSALEGAWRLVTATDIELTLGMLVIRCGKLMLQLQKPERPSLPDVDPEHVQEWEFQWAHALQTEDRDDR
ncbi:unnamed protein product, partial [Symbiodinium sp. CCMP2456]